MTTSLDYVNPRVRAIRVSTQSFLQNLAHQITQNMTQGGQKPLKGVIDLSSGDPHRAGMKPVSFVRQVLAVCLYPHLLQDTIFPLDVKLRAQRLLQICEGQSLGSYTASSGLHHIRQTIADFITKRDTGISANPRNVFISSGAQRALMVVVKLLSSGEGQTQTGILAPQPCPHTLPPLLDEAGVLAVPYRLMEERGWALDLNQLRQALDSSRGGCNPRAVYISNPGNPTGHVQDRKSIQEVIQLATAEKLLLLVDEVYQDSVYGQNTEFLSYKKVLFEMGQEFSETVELVSFHSLSCASVAECGLRAGYMEAVNIDPDVMKVFDTMLCTDISAPTTGQLALDLMLNPPGPGEPSYDTHAQELLLTRTVLTRNAQRALEVLNDLPGFSCQPAMGGIYLYPSVKLPAGIREQAEMLGLGADVFYCQKLLEEELLLLGAGQYSGEAGSHHFRLCVLVPTNVLEDALHRLSAFHLHLMGHHTVAGRNVKGKAGCSSQSGLTCVQPTTV
ncbi:alanine aminotransferase 2 [Oryzias latipes]|uniref:alanine transaminase n=1 Tax=Oryzias latipes TaxID=8090 RepID=H2MCK3_ORYLA|nr:alanine aminotransferase 2 [Oryzias latipes]